MDLTCKALAVLLGYPGRELVEALPEIRGVLESDRRLPRAQRRSLVALCDELAAAEGIAAEERYVALFDRSRATSLNLFEHVHGDSRDRGQAMVDLKATYAQAGLALAARELPDYLPALLEFASLQPAALAREWIRETAHIVRAIGEALAARGSGYAAVFAAILALAGEKGLAADPRPPEDKPLDLDWAEEPVVFGPAGAPGACAAAAKPAVVQFVPRAGRAIPGAAR